MKNIDIVLGLGYGDEGKGTTVSYLANKSPNPLVVRFSGGPQAGHTVMANGKKHIHSNFGSGTLEGHPSYFTEHTCVYPVTIERERKVLEGKGVIPLLYIHPLAKVITPFDVWENRADERNLADGSCGLGIGKTMKRNEASPYKLYAADLSNNELVIEKLRAISNWYGLKYSEDLNDEVNEFTEAIKYPSWIVHDYTIFDFYNLVFEGSQGILLDRQHGVFPHVTYANTTCENAIDAITKQYSAEDVTVNTYYVTRCYSTRHGAGPFLESKTIADKLINNEEEINVYNEYQEEFKVGELDYKLLRHAIYVDNCYNLKSVVRNLVVTCMDQLIDFRLDKEKFNGLEINQILTSHGPRVGDMKKIRDEEYA